MKKVLVTGGTGFIGKHTLIPLIELGYEVHVVTSSQNVFIQKDVVVHQENLLDCSTHQRLMNRVKPTHLLHCAWYTENGKFWEAIENIYWLKATLSLVDAFYEEGGRRVLGLGTCAEYDWNYGLCVEGETPENPTSLYGKVKKSAFECLSALTKSQSRSFAWCRIFFPYGPGEPESRLIPHVITSLLRDEEARCTHGNQIRDFMHVADMGSALASVLDSDIEGAINIGSGNPVKIREVVNSIALALGKEDLVRFGAIQEPSHSPRMILANTDRLKNEVCWTPALTLDEGLLTTINWWRNEETMNLISGE